ncbi:hypothetical protein AT251_02570 [Enterovibrio nigricans]|nr:hypothetical protein AT251_02570 [Enterovibrio nigricans]
MKSVTKVLQDEEVKVANEHRTLGMLLVLKKVVMDFPTALECMKNCLYDTEDSKKAAIGCFLSFKRLLE